MVRTWASLLPEGTGSVSRQTAVRSLRTAFVASKSAHRDRGWWDRFAAAGRASALAQFRSAAVPPGAGRLWVIPIGALAP